MRSIAPHIGAVLDWLQLTSNSTGNTAGMQLFHARMHACLHIPPPPLSPFVLCAGGCGCGTGGSGRPDHLGATSRRIFASCSRFCPRLTASACLVSFALSRNSLVADCLCAWRHLPLVVFFVLTGMTGWSGGTVAAVLRGYGGMSDRFGRLDGA